MRGAVSGSDGEGGVSYEKEYWLMREKYIELVLVLGFSHKDVRPFAKHESHESFVARAKELDMFARVA